MGLSKEAAAQRARAKDIIGRKDAELASINDETSRIVAAHQDLMDAVAQKMTDLGVPTAELGFAPLQTSALQTSVFQQSRVPSQRRQTVYKINCQYRRHPWRSPARTPRLLYKSR